MAKKPKRKNFRPPRKCIFCGEGGERGNPMSGEHVWPEWMHPLLPNRPGQKNQQGYRIIQSMGLVKNERRKPRHGAPYTKKIHVVCKRCNESWMSGIETNAQYVLRPLVSGQPTRIDVFGQNVLAYWIALKVMVLEMEQENDSVLWPDQRTEFMKTRAIPSTLKIWIAPHTLFSWASAYWLRTMRGYFDSTKYIPGAFKDVQTVSLGAGHLFIFAFNSTLREIDPEPQINRDGVLTRIWPLNMKAVDWPRPLPPDGYLDAVAETLTELMRSPFVEWKPLATRRPL